MKIPVKEVARKNDSVLVEYIDETMTVRKVLSHRNIMDGKVDSEVLDHAAPYGVQVAELVGNWDLADFPTKLEAACRDRGLWTKDDFIKNPALVMASLQQALRFDTTYLISLIQNSDD
jgi:hypothetical protein